MEQIKGRKWTITACSAKEKFGLEEGLGWLVESMKN